MYPGRILLNSGISEKTKASENRKITTHVKASWLANQKQKRETAVMKKKLLERELWAARRRRRIGLNYCNPNGAILGNKK